MVSPTLIALETQMPDLQAEISNLVAELTPHTLLHAYACHAQLRERYR
jgi:hypothetical protein